MISLFWFFTHYLQLLKYFLWIFFVFFQTAKMLFLTETLPGSYVELKKKMIYKKKHKSETNKHKHSMFVQQCFIDDICERTLWPKQPTYIETVCAMLEARLGVARLCTSRGVFLCYCVQCVTKTKSAQTLGD